jgi:hypothetical protein
MDPTRGDTSALGIDDREDSSSDWMSANDAARSESLTSLSGSVAFNDDTASSPIKRPGDQWEVEPEQIIDNDHIVDRDALHNEILDQEDVPFTMPVAQRHAPEEEIEEEEEAYPINRIAEDHIEQQRQQQPSPSAAEQGLSRASGASLFSVPPTSAPHSGVYDMPLEAFEFRDLDSGKTFHLDKRYWIKDVDTGKVYVLEPEEDERVSNQGASGAEVGTAGGSTNRGGSAGGRSTPGSGTGASSMRVSELISGVELSLEEFEAALGYFREPPEPYSEVVDSEDEEEERDLAAQAQLIAQRGLQSLSLGKIFFF